MGRRPLYSEERQSKGDTAHLALAGGLTSRQGRRRPVGLLSTRCLSAHLPAMPASPASSLCKGARALRSEAQVQASLRITPCHPRRPTESHPGTSRAFHASDDRALRSPATQSPQRRYSAFAICVGYELKRSKYGLRFDRAPIWPCSLLPILPLDPNTRFSGRHQ